MFARMLTKGARTWRFVVQKIGAEGWEVREEQDSRLVRHVCYRDWHRVERALAVFDLQASRLQRDGWQEAEATSL